MGEDWGLCFPRPQFDWQSPCLNSLSAPLHMGQQNTIPAFMNPGTNMASTTRTLPVYAYPDLPQSQVGQANEPRGWFYCLPRFRQGLVPASNSTLKEQLPANPFEIFSENMTPKLGSAQKSFVVFDQSSNQTTLIFSSAIGTPVHCPTWSPKLPDPYNLNKADPGTNADLNLHSRPGPISVDGFDENYRRNGMQSEMHDDAEELHEDTEELNALLYSDDDSDYTEDDEVTSTGHSPSTMTAQDGQDWFEGSTEEVASSAGPTKKRKLFDGGNDDIPLLIDTASSVKPNGCLEDEDDAESSGANGKNSGSGEMGSLSGHKRMRKEKIRETVNVLQSIIPGGKGKDAIVVLDEAIHYLKYLKFKAKALGLDTL